MQITDGEKLDINRFLGSLHHPPLSSNKCYIHKKAKVNGTIISSEENKRAKKSNDYTIKFKDNNNAVKFGIVKKFINLGNYTVTAIKTLSVKVAPRQNIDSYITAQNSKFIFSDYLLYKVTGEKYILIDQITAKCINLSYKGCNMLTSVINNIEDNTV